MNNTEIIEAIPHNPNADSFDFQKSLEMVKQAIFCHKLLIAFTIMLTLGIVIVYMVAFPANYQAEVIVIADTQDDVAREDFYSHWALFRKHPLPDEAEMMTSAAVVGMVVDKMELKYDDVYHSFLNHLGYLWVESWIGKKYRAFKTWLFPPKTQYTLSEEEFERGKTINSFKDGVALRVVPETHVGALVVRGPSPRVADIANTMIDLYLEDRRNRLVAEAETAYKALKIESDKALKELREVEMKIEEHFKQNDMLIAFEKDKVEVGTWLELKASIVESEAKLAYYEETLKEIDRQLLSEQRDTVASRVTTKNSARVKLRDQIVQLQILLEQAEIRYNSNAPEVTEIKEQINALTGLWQQEEEVEEAQATQLISENYQSLKSRKSVLLSEIQGLRANLKVKRAADERIESKLKTLPVKINKTNQLERERGLIETRYMGLSNKLMIATVSKATIESAPAAIRVVDYAEYPEKPYWPKAKYLVLGAIVFGAMMGVIAAMLLDLVYGRVSRYRLSASTSHNEIYAVLSRDSRFLNRLYDLSGSGNRALPKPIANP